LGFIAPVIASLFYSNRILFQMDKTLERLTWQSWQKSQESTRGKQRAGSAGTQSIDQKKMF
jgi:hypothetical protein